MMKHKVTYATFNYPFSGDTELIKWFCTCGEYGQVTDSKAAPTKVLAKSAAAKHYQES